MTIGHFSLEYLDNRAPQIRASLNERLVAMRPQASFTPKHPLYEAGNSWAISVPGIESER